jgi:hypothetical protein
MRMNNINLCLLSPLPKGDVVYERTLVELNQNKVTITYHIDDFQDSGGRLKRVNIRSGTHPYKLVETFFEGNKKNSSFELLLRRRCCLHDVGIRIDQIKYSHKRKGYGEGLEKGGGHADVV